MIELKPGSLVGRYEIERRIGVGGMAEVYLAHARNDPSARVAIKRLLPAFAHEPRLNEMFVAEARLAAKLLHPNIVKVLDVGIDHELCYFAMEYIDGHDVRSLLAAAVSRESRLPLEIALSIMYGTTCALAYVHDPNGPHAKLNIVHRDVSPSNIIVSYEGAIKLVDFGIARVETGAGPRTASGGLKGKIPYMSPEQCRALSLDGRSDLFSLGVVLYELTTGMRPFDRESEFDTLEAIVRGEFTRPSRRVEGLPAGLEDIMMRLLAPRRSDRYPSAGVLLVDLDRIVAEHALDLSNEALAAHIRALLDPTAPPSPPTKATRLARVKPRQAAVPSPSAPVVPPRASARAARLETVPGAGVSFEELQEAAATAPPVSTIPSDRYAARCGALLERVAPGIVDANELPASAVAQLFGHAVRYQARGDLESAVLALELAMSARPGSDIDDLIASHGELIDSVHAAFIGSQSRMVAVSQHLERLVGLALDQRTAFLLSRIDGTLRANELIATCGLPRREACRHLCQLLLRELVLLV